jgi:cytochrome b
MFHWTLALLVLGQWLSYRYAEAIGDETLVWHRWGGLTILTLVVWRVLWGLTGSGTARFGSFVRAPSAVAAYARDMFSGRVPRPYLGHNPLGAYMVVALLAVTLAQGGFGLFATDENELTGGPLYRLVSEASNAWATRWHGRIFDYVLMPLILLHVAANLLYGVVKKEPLILAMITGRKPAQPYADTDGNAEPPGSLFKALSLLVCSAALVLGAIIAAGGRL